MRKFLAVTTAFLTLGFGQAEASVACFAPADAQEAELRRMQQEFTVAALSCGQLQTQRDEITARYNKFVDKFGVKLKDNARILQAHFMLHGGTDGFDSWMTKLANVASQDVATDPNYCRNAWLNMDAALTITPDNIVAFAANGRGTDDLVPICGEQKPHKAKVAAKAKTAHKAAPKKTDQN